MANSGLRGAAIAIYIIYTDLVLFSVSGRLKNWVEGFIITPVTKRIISVDKTISYKIRKIF